MVSNVPLNCVLRFRRHILLKITESQYNREKGLESAETIRFNFVVHNLIAFTIYIPS